MSTAPLYLHDSIWDVVKDFLAPIDLYNFHNTCTTFRKLVSLETVIKSAGAGNTAHEYGFWPGNYGMNIFLQSIKVGKVYKPSVTRMLRIVLHADGGMNGSIGCEFCPGAHAKAKYFSSGHGILLCCRLCKMESYQPGEICAENGFLSWPLSELPSAVEKLLLSQPQSAAYVKWWKSISIINTTAKPVVDAATGERCGSVITKIDLDAMAVCAWSPEKLKAVLPSKIESSEMKVLLNANQYALAYAKRRFS